MKALSLFIFLTCIWQSAFAYNVYSHTYCQQAQKEGLFYTSMKYDYPNPDATYRNFFDQYFQKRKITGKKLINCMAKKGVGCEKKYQDVQDFVRDNYDQMKISLMVIANSTKVKHLVGDDERYLKISKKQKEEFLKIQKRYQRRRGKQNSAVRLELKKTHEKMYLGIITSWPYFRYIDQLDTKNSDAIELAVIDGTTRQMLVMDAGIREIRAGADKILRTKVMADFFMEENFDYNYQLCDYVEDIYQEIESNQSQHTWTMVLAPITTAIGACVVLTPAGCIITSVAIGITATGYDINRHQEEFKQQEIIGKVDINTSLDIYDAEKLRNRLIAVSPLNLLEVLIAAKFLRALK